MIGPRRLIRDTIHTCNDIHQNQITFAVLIFWCSCWPRKRRWHSDRLCDVRRDVVTLSGDVTQWLWFRASTRQTQKETDRQTEERTGQMGALLHSVIRQHDAANCQPKITDRRWQRRYDGSKFEPVHFALSY